MNAQRFKDSFVHADRSSDERAEHFITARDRGIHGGGARERENPLYFREDNIGRVQGPQAGVGS